MVKQDGAETRRERISKIARYIQATFAQNKGAEIKLSNLVGVIMYDEGLTREKIMEYLRVIEMKGQIEIDEDKDTAKKPEM
jgi:hypothetical protein